MNPVIGIIACGLDIRDSSIRQFVSHTYIDAITCSGGIPVILPILFPLQDLPIQNIFSDWLSLCNGFLFCGGGDISPTLMGENPMDTSSPTDIRTDKFHLSFLKLLLDHNRPVLGICRGMQLINVACGGTIYQDLSFAHTPAFCHMQNTLERSDIFHTVIFQKNSMLYNIFEESVDTNSFHHQAIQTPGNDLVIVGETSDHVPEAIESCRHSFVAGVQWHPECMYHTSQKMRSLFYSFLEASK